MRCRRIVAWVIEVADHHTECRVVGTDLSPIQPIEVPENVEFFVADLVDGLDFDTGSTDLVNSRLDPYNFLNLANLDSLRVEFVNINGRLICKKFYVF